jgi:phage/plasmid-like protein (TIGR03299 family)
MSDYVESMFSVGEPAWHGKGMVPDRNPVDAEEAMKWAGLNWMVDLKPVFAEVGTTKIPIPDSRAVVRLDTNEVFKIVSNEYEVIQNSVMFDFLDALIGVDNVKLETAGSLKGGRVVWAATELLGEAFDIKGDENKTYLTTFTSHDKSMVFQATVGNIRVVCWNTLKMNLQSANNKYTIRHIGDVDNKIEEAQQALGLAVKWNEVFKEAAEELAGQSMEDELFVNIMTDAFGIEEDADNYDEKYDTIVDEFYSTGDESPKISGTKYAALQGVTHYLDYTRPYKSSEQLTQRLVIGDARADNIKAATFNILMGDED